VANICASGLTDNVAVINKVITSNVNTIKPTVNLYSKAVYQVSSITPVQYTVTSSTQSMNKTTLEPMNGSTTPSGGKPRPGTGQFWPR
jgi:hypothetical protein